MIISHKFHNVLFIHIRPMHTVYNENPIVSDYTYLYLLTKSSFIQFQTNKHRKKNELLNQLMNNEEMILKKVIIKVIIVPVTLLI